MNTSDWLASVVSHQHLAVSLLVVFVGGLALNLTPCVYPMIPITVAFFSGQATGSWRRAGLLAGGYLLGLSVSYALLGLVAATTGKLLGSWLQQPAVLVGIALLLVGLSLGMFGLYELQPPPFITNRLGRSAAGLWGAVAMGAVVGLVAAPCIGPFVLGLILVVGQLANPLAGFALFFALGLGMGLPYLVLGIAANQVAKLPKAGAWLLWSKHAMGFMLWGLALYMTRPLLPGGVLKGAAVVLLAVAGVYLGWLGVRQGSRGIFRRIRWAVGAGLLVAATLVARPQQPAASPIPWKPYTAAALAQATREQRPAIVDIYADWCIPCVELDHVTFRHPDVVKALGNVATLRLDVTRDDISKDGEALLDRYRVIGVPTVLLFDTTGKERTDLRLEGFEGPKEFLRRLQHLQ